MIRTVICTSAIGFHVFQWQPLPLVIVNLNGGALLLSVCQRLDVCNQDFLVFSQNFQSNTTLRFQGEPSQIMLTMYTYHYPPLLSLSPSPSIPYFRSIVHVDRIMLLQKICAYIRVCFFSWEFFFRETATAQENLFFSD